MVPGAVIGGKYRIERALARGGMGSLWVARHVQLGSTVAIKFLDASFAASPAHRARFEREARAAANLKSPHVVHVQDYGFEGAAPYIVMELLEGEDLGQRLHRVRRMSVRDTGRVLAQAAKALRKAHEAGIAHRDLKPANLFLARIDDEEIVKVLDFGIAKEQHAPLGEATRTGEVIGSPHYMSPEQVHADRDIDHRTDLWSLGIILFRMLVGSLPFPGDQLGPVLAKILTSPIPVPSQVAPDLPPSMDAFFARALARDREHRFQSIGEMVEAFHAAAGGLDTMSSASLSLQTGAIPAGGGTVAWNPIGASSPITGTGPTGSGPIPGAGHMGASGPITGAGHMGSGPIPMGASGPIPGAGHMGSGPIPMGASGPITGAGHMGASGPITGAGHMGSGPIPMGAGGPITGAGPIGGSGPITGAAPISSSGPITGAGPMGMSGVAAVPFPGPGTAGGLANTSPPKARSAAPLVALGAIGALAAVAVAAFLFTGGSPEAAEPAATGAPEPTPAPVLSASATEPAPAPSTSAADVEPVASATDAPSAPAEEPAAPAVSATASPKATATRPKPTATATAKPKEKWF